MAGSFKRFSHKVVVACIMVTLPLINLIIQVIQPRTVSSCIIYLPSLGDKCLLSIDLLIIIGLPNDIIIQGIIRYYPFAKSMGWRNLRTILLLSNRLPHIPTIIPAGLGWSGAATTRPASLDHWSLTIDQTEFHFEKMILWGYSYIIIYNIYLNYLCIQFAMVKKNNE